MRRRLSVMTRGVSALLAVLCTCLLACVGGHIPPSMFQSTNVVPYTPPGPGGWKVAQVAILMGRISPIFSSTAVCEIEVGVPERNWKGWVTDEFAQVEAARAADEAARIVLREQQPTALACKAFRDHMQSILGDANFGTIPGATVSGFKWGGVPRVTFP
jgi:hypothetical protein